MVQQAGFLGAIGLQRVQQAEHFAAGDLRGAQPVQQLGTAEAQQRGFDQGHQGGAVGRAGHIGGKALVRGPFGLVDHLVAEAHELAVVAHGDDQRAVGRLEHAIGHDGGVGIAELGGIAGLEQRFHAVVAGDHQPAVVQCHLHMAAGAGAFALQQCGQNGLGRVHAGEHVHSGHAKFQRALAGLAVHGHDAALALHHQVIAGALGLAAAAAVAGNRAVHQARVQGRQLFVAQAQFLGATDLEVLHHHVALRGQLAGHLQAGFGLQVQRDGALVAVGAVEVRGVARAPAHAPVAGVVAAGRVFDLDHVGAEVGQGHGAHRAGQHARQVQHADAGQRLEGGGVVHACLSHRPGCGRQMVQAADFRYV